MGEGKCQLLESVFIEKSTPRDCWGCAADGIIIIAALGVNSCSPHAHYGVH